MPLNFERHRPPSRVSAHLFSPIWKARRLMGKEPVEVVTGLCVSVTGANDIDRIAFDGELRPPPELAAAQGLMALDSNVAWGIWAR